MNRPARFPVPPESGRADLWVDSRRRLESAHATGQGRAAVPRQEQLERAFELARRHVRRYSCRCAPSQTADPTRAALPMIVDTVGGTGPIVGIRSALTAFPGVAWLVLACDLPFLSDAVLEQLVARARCSGPGHRISQRPRWLARTAVRHLGTRGRRGARGISGEAAKTARENF